MGKVIDFWTGRELPPEEPQRSYRIDQARRTQLCRIAAFSEALVLLTPDDLLQVIQKDLPEETDLHCHPFELTSEQAYRLVAILRTSTQQAGTFGKGRRRAGDFINHGAPDEWLRPYGYNSRVPRLRQRARARAQQRPTRGASGGRAGAATPPGAGAHGGGEQLVRILVYCPESTLPSWKTRAFGDSQSVVAWGQGRQEPRPR